MSHKSLPEGDCQWRPLLDRSGIEWGGGEKVTKPACYLCLSRHWRSWRCKPCTATLQFYDYVEWLQFLVRPLLMEQWGLEAQGEIWYQGTVCVPCLCIACLPSVTFTFA